MLKRSLIVGLLLAVSACATSYPQSDSVLNVSQTSRIYGTVRGSNLYETEFTIEAYNCLGGWVHSYAALANYVVKSGKEMRWHSSMISACSTMADKIWRDGGKQCLVSRRVTMGIHQANYGTKSGGEQYRDLYGAYSPKMQKMIRSLGGFPQNGGMLSIRASTLVATGMYKFCVDTSY